MRLFSKIRENYASEFSFLKALYVNSILVPSKGPENVVAYTINCHHVRITWDSINATLKNGILVNYFVQYWMNGSAESSLHSVGPNDTQANISQLEPWKSYFFKIAGSTSAGSGVFSSIVNVQPIYAGENNYSF